VSVPAANVEEIADRAAGRQLLGLAQRRVVAVVEADAHENARPTGRFDHLVQIAGTPRGGLLDQRVLAGGDGPQRYFREEVVCDTDDHDVDIGPLDDRPPVGRWFRVSRRRTRDGLGPLHHTVGAGHERAIAEGPRPLLSHEAASDDADLHLNPSPFRGPRG